MTRSSCSLGSRIRSWLRDYDRIQGLAVFLIYIQIICSLVGSLGALYNGVLLINLVVALFALVAIESSNLRLGRTYVVLLACAILLDVAWFILFSYTIWNIAPEKYGAYFVFSLRLALSMQIIGFLVRFLSPFLWIQMYRLGVSCVDSTVYRAADFDVRSSFLSPTSHGIARQNSNSDDVLGGSIYDPAHYSFLFEDAQAKGCANEFHLQGDKQIVSHDGGTTSATEAPQFKSCISRSFQNTFQSSSMTLSPSLFSDAQNIAKMNSGLPNMSSIGTAHVGRQSDSSAVKIVAISKTISNMHSETSTANQTSSKFSSYITPIKSTVIVQVKSQASEQLNMKSGEDGLTRSFPSSMKQGTVTPEISFGVLNESSISSLSSISAIPSTGLNENTAQVDRITSKNQSSETVSTIASLPTVSISSLPFLPVMSSASLTSSIVSVFAAPLSSASLPTMAFGGSSLGSKISAESNQTASVPSSTMVASNQSHLSSSSPPFQAQKSYVSPLFSSASESSATHTPPSYLSEASSRSEAASLQAPASKVLVDCSEISSSSEPTSLEAPKSEALVGFASKGEVSLLTTSTSNMFTGAFNSLLEMPSAITPPANTTTTEKDEGLDLIVSQEDEMDEAPDTTTTMLNLGALSGTVPSSAPKPNPFGGPFGAAPSTANSPLLWTASAGELFRPASFSLPPAQPVQPSQSVNSGPCSGGLSGGFSGFGQPAQIGSRQQALVSIFGAFGQSRQLGAGAQGIGFASSGGFGGGAFSAEANSGGGFPSSGGFVGAATGGGFTSVASSGGGCGFAGVATGEGFSAITSSSGGFAAAASAGSGGGSAVGGFGAFCSNQGSSFSAFGGSNATGARNPPAELMQMRK